MPAPLDEETFFERFQPRPNHFIDGEPDDLDLSTCLYETYGDEVEFVRAQPEATVWTLVEEDGAEFILPGVRTVNRSGFLVTTVAWDDRELVVKLD